MDLQYVPEVIAAPDAPGMVDLLGRIARERGAGLFHRYAIMRYWREVENMPFAQFTSDDGLHLNDWSYDCIARLLADAIVEAAARPSIAASGNAPRTL